MYSIFQHLAQKNGVSAYEVSKATGVPQSLLSDWKRGRSAPKAETLVKLANYFNVSVDYLIGNEKPAPAGWVPVLGRVAAGIPIEAIQDVVDMEQLSPDFDRSFDYCGLVIHGNSMEPKMSDGDVVIVRIQPTIEDGDTAVVFVNGDEATCKKIKKTPEGIFLISNNPAYAPVFYSNKEIEDKPISVFGKVVELRAKF